VLTEVDPRPPQAFAFDVAAGAVARVLPSIRGNGAAPAKDIRGDDRASTVTIAVAQDGDSNMPAGRTPAATTIPMWAQFVPLSGTGTA
jgi:hypothetical protein